MKTARNWINAMKHVNEKGENVMFEIYRDKDNKFRFRIKARNGKIIAVSEAYQNRRNCENGIDSVITNVRRENLKIKDLT